MCEGRGGLGSHNRACPPLTCPSPACSPFTSSLASLEAEHEEFCQGQLYDSEVTFSLDSLCGEVKVGWHPAARCCPHRLPP